MTRGECILTLKPYLANLGYKKKDGYWYKRENDIIHCACVIGSQWNTDDYYIEIGVAIPDTVGLTPSLGNWYVRKICSDSVGNNVNVDLNIFYAELNTFREIHSADNLYRYVNEARLVKLGEQYFLD